LGKEGEKQPTRRQAVWLKALSRAGRISGMTIKEEIKRHDAPREGFPENVKGETESRIQGTLSYACTKYSDSREGELKARSGRTHMRGGEPTEPPEKRAKGFGSLIPEENKNAAGRRERSGREYRS